ncbi:DUF488 family protein [Edwardsiella ictaluri]|uniref:DUF488 domain-containing protein n=1 Tax=Edwardsiella ictaluri TaxID=67780 RepID=UPI0009BD313C|nr:DUF488 family protein [Edwardsiella ictaluri]ARD40152.1 MarR family transcriptional regulator [Edwardsiella ictaluri]QPW25696.1 DUF488 family protein [Edwardsiella ictaluri]
MVSIGLQRVYDVWAPCSPHTFLTDRLWPRGIAKARLDGVHWQKEVAPSTALRQAFHHAQLDWPAFVARYREELAANPRAWQSLVQLLCQGESLTLLYGSRDSQCNQAVALRDWLLEQLIAGE